MPTIAIANQKGGVGKTTTVVNLAAYLAEAGMRVLVVDCDPQGNATTGLGVDKRALSASLYDALLGDEEPTAIVQPTSAEGVHLMPATVDLAGAEVELVAMQDREYRLQKVLARFRDRYDLILLDCPPSLGLMTLNALTAADGVIIPIQCEFYALEGLSQLMQTIERVREGLNRGLVLEGIVLTMFDARTNLAIQVADEVKRHFRGKVYASVIPRNVRLSEAPSHGRPISRYDPRSRGAEVYRELAREVRERLRGAGGRQRA